MFKIGQAFESTLNSLYRIVSYRIVIQASDLKTCQRTTEFNAKWPL